MSQHYYQVKAGCKKSKTKPVFNATQDKCKRNIKRRNCPDCDKWTVIEESNDHENAKYTYNLGYKIKAGDFLAATFCTAPKSDKPNNRQPVIVFNICPAMVAKELVRLY